MCELQNKLEPTAKKLEFSINGTKIKEECLLSKYMHSAISPKGENGLLKKHTLLLKN